MVSVNWDNQGAAAADAEGEARPVDGQKLLLGLRQQLDLADQLDLDLVAIRIAEALDQLILDLEQNGSAPVSSYRH